MDSKRIAGTEGYAHKAGLLLTSWENVSFADKHRAVLHLIPSKPSRILDIGAGAGGDAAALADMGHSLTAVEPVDELRVPAMTLRPSPRIEWVKDSLPELAVLAARGDVFDVVMLSAVWMHFDRSQRQMAMPGIAALARSGGVVLMSLRHGSPPPGRRMFEVSAAETIALASRNGLRCLLEQQTPSVQAANRASGVTWSQLAFAKV
jgi:2-polyprenyl-3-methyl-5-hydroxy-6-metoxy-1,4-benzoquinol methylase